MTALWLIALTIVAPIVPWVGLASFWASRVWLPASIWIVFIGGLVLDLWWGKPLGQSSLVLLALTVVIWSADRAWPASGRSFWPLAAALSLVVLEGYLIIS